MRFLGSSLDARYTQYNFDLLRIDSNCPREDHSKVEQLVKALLKLCKKILGIKFVAGQVFNVFV